MGPTSPKTPILGAWIMNMHFKPNMRKIPIDIFSDLCIRLRWNLTSSCSQQQRLRGWSRMVVKQFQDGGRPPFWKLIYRHISVKNHPISMNFVHSSRFWTEWTSRDQKWKSCIGQTPSSTERISCVCKKITLGFGARVLLAPPPPWIRPVVLIHKMTAWPVSGYPICVEHAEIFARVRVLAINWHWLTADCGTPSAASSSSSLTCRTNSPRFVYKIHVFTAILCLQQLNYIFEITTFYSPFSHFIAFCWWL